MIKLTTTQARIIAKKIRKQVLDSLEQEKKTLKEKLISKEQDGVFKEYQNLVMSGYQLAIKLDTKVVVGNYGYYFSIEKSTTDEELKKNIDKLISYYFDLRVNNIIKSPIIYEDDLAEDLMFDAINSDDLQQLMETYIAKYKGV